METIGTGERRTSAEDIFDYLHREIITLNLMPGARLSEVEVAKRFNVSRQPVREAFIRLENLRLLSIRPQKATMVRKFSLADVTRARFVRIAVECEVLRHAATTATAQDFAVLERNLAEQERAIAADDVERFHELDYDFHRLLCCAANLELMFETISAYKAQVDRLCLLSLTAPAAMSELLDDHLKIYRALERRNERALVDSARRHLARLGDTIEAVRQSHVEYFEDDG